MCYGLYCRASAGEATVFTVITGSSTCAMAGGVDLIYTHERVSDSRNDNGGTVCNRLCASGVEEPIAAAAYVILLLTGNFTSGLLCVVCRLNRVRVILYSLKHKTAYSTAYAVLLGCALVILNVCRLVCLYVTACTLVPVLLGVRFPSRGIAVTECRR